MTYQQTFHFISSLDGTSVGFVNTLQADAFDLHKESRLMLKLKNFKLNPTEEDHLEIERIKTEKLEESKIEIEWNEANEQTENQ